MATATLSEQLAEQKTAAVEAYRKLVADSLKRTPTLEEIRPILAAAERTVGDFEQDVETRRKRIQAAQDIQRAKQIEKQIDDARNIATKAHDQHKAIEKECEERLRKSREEWLEAQRAASSLEDNRKNLHVGAMTVLRSTSDLAIDREIAELDITIRTAERDLHEYMRDVTDVEFYRQRQIEEHQSMYGDTVPVPEPSTRYKHLTSMRDRCEATIKSSRQRIEELEAARIDPKRQRWAETEEESHTPTVHIIGEPVMKHADNFSRLHIQGMTR